MISTKKLIVLLFVVVIIFIGINIFFISTQEAIVSNVNAISQNEISQLPGCKIASSPKIYSKLVVFSEKFENAIDHYRESWQNVCNGKSTRSLFLLWVEAKTLTDLSNEIYGLNDYSEDNSYFIEKFPLFVPGIQGSFAEGYLGALKPSISLFAENAVLGTEEDRDFFTTLSSLGFDKNFSPWIEQTWDYGGCTTYGEYDWIKNLTILDSISKKIKSPVYLTAINSAKEKLLANFTYGYGDYSAYEVQPKVCTCGKTEKVLSDFQNIQQYLASDPSHKDLVSMVSNAVVEISNGSLKVISETEQHCSGG
ncbi:MAG: hypothetical protein WCI76_02000 [bacterium]